MVHGTSNHELFENLRLELRRGSLVLACLAALRQERYGYTLRKTLEEQGMAIDAGTLYPLLRRLESQGLLLSEWREEEKRNKRFYRLSADGKLILKQLLGEWQSISSSLNGMLSRTYGARYGRRAGPTAHGIGTAGAAQEAREPAGAGRSLPPGLSHTGVWPPINRARTISLLRKGVVFQPGPDLCGHRHHFHRAGRERPESRGQ